MLPLVLDHTEKNSWCKKNCLNFSALKQAVELKREINFILDKDRKLLMNDDTKELIHKNMRQNKIESLDVRIHKCLLSAFFQNLCLYSGTPKLGYTLISRNLNLRIYGTSSLNLQGLNPKWIICSEICQNNFNYCKVTKSLF